VLVYFDLAAVPCSHPDHRRAEGFLRDPQDPPVPPGRVDLQARLHLPLVPAAPSSPPSSSLHTKRQLQVLPEKETGVHFLFMCLLTASK
jgi:hypothetical protein